jgi:protein ImuB
MFACLYLPPRVDASDQRLRPARGAEGKRGEAAPPSASERGWGPASTKIVQVARDFSPRVETYGDRTVTLDISGLGSLIGEPRSIGEELRRTAADAGLRVHIAVAATSTAAILLAHARAGLTVVPRGEEAAALAPLPLRTLTLLGFGLQALDSGPGTHSLKPTAHSPEPDVEQLARWGLRTLGDLASLPSGELSARLGQAGLRWQRWARGEEMRPLVPAGAVERFEESLDLEWPIDGLEPLSFVLARLFDPLCERLERGDRGAVVLRITLTLVTSASARSATAGPRRSLGEGGRDLHERVVELPAPMRDARVLRTLALLDLESNPPPAAIDRVAVGVDVTEGRVLQFGLFARALPSDKLATLLARLGVLMGSDRVGAPSLVDTYRPGAFTMAKFDPPRSFANHQSQIPNPRLCAPESDALRRGSPEPSAEAAQASSVLRRFRSPIPARVTLEQGRPVRVTTDRRGFAGGRVERCEGPWRSSGDWWRPTPATHATQPSHPWNCDEWDVALSDGTTYRISLAHNEDAWFVDGMLD